MSFKTFGLKDKAKLDGMIEYLSKNLGVPRHEVRDIFTEYPIFNPFADFIKGKLHSYDITNNRRAEELLIPTSISLNLVNIKTVALGLSINDITGLNRNNIIFAYYAIIVKTPSYQDIYNDALYFGIIGSSLSRKSSYYDLILAGVAPFHNGEFSYIELKNKNIYKKVCVILNREDNKQFDNFWNPSEINLAELFKDNIKDECHNPI